MKSPRTPMVQPLSATLRKARGAFFYVAIFSGIINLLMLTGPLYMMQVYDRVLSSRSLPTLVALSALVVGLYAFCGLLELIRTRLMIRIGRLAEAELRAPVFTRMLDHAVKRTPNVGTQPLRDLDTIRQFMSGPGPFALFDIPWVPLYIAVNYILHPWLGHMTVAATVVLLLLALASEWSSRRGVTEIAAASQGAHNLAEEAHASAELLHAMAMRRTYAARWSREVDRSVRQQSRSADRASIFSSVSKTVRLALQSLALAVGAYIAIQGEITAGVIIAGSIILSRALSPIDQAIAHWRQYGAYRQAKRRIDAALEQSAAADERMPLPPPKGALSAEGLTVLAPGTSAPLVAGVTFALPAGGGLAIVGPSGAGKSSLARALVGVWPAARGAVRLDGAKLDQYPDEQLGRSVGYVPQDAALLSGTLEDNIARFDDQPDAARVVAAARRANVHELIVRLQDGYNTRVGPGGIQLSAGQRQRIALARALYGDPPLLVLDEPNSNLDGDGESALLAALNELRSAGKTVVIIAHRPSAIRVVDHLLYIKEGCQVAFGPKEEVLDLIRREKSPQVAPPLAVVGR